ncbi:MAG: glycosyl transferase family 2 [Planctomycetota bacterium]|nr:MAG: glycosyl transferase family 2 [Planctomycetota bacterium]
MRISPGGPCPFLTILAASFMDFLLLAFLYVLLAVLGLHGLYRLTQIAAAYSGQPPKEPGRPEGELAALTLQLPIYNERYVATRLLQSCAALRWPRERLQIQVLDDSDDVSSSVIADEVAALQEQGIDIVQIRRGERHGYKAGALAAGLHGALDFPPARGEFIAILDADFVPEPDFLERCAASLLQDEGLGVVQARWGHLNREHSLLTRIEALFLDAHFGIEHQARQATNQFLGFNGTAGVWRRQAIEDAGGWSHDTLTEDLDISYRAQLAGWRILYLHDLVAPAELPAEMNAFKSQQFRWAKGSIECARKLLRMVWTAPGLRESTRLEACCHLLSNATYPVVLLLSLLALPITGLASAGRMAWPLRFEGLVFGMALLPVLLQFLLGQLRVGRSLRQSLPLLLPAVALGIGLSLGQSRAVLEAAFGKRSGFVRTPKYKLTERTDSWLGKSYLSKGRLQSCCEIALGLACTCASGLSLLHSAYALAAMMLLFAAGYCWVGWASLLPSLFEHSRAKRASKSPSP